MLAGDFISKIDGQDVRGLKPEEAVDKMRGAVGTPIKLTILRKGAEKPIELTIVRDVIAGPRGEGPCRRGCRLSQVILVYRKRPSRT